MHVSAGCSWRSGGGEVEEEGTRTGREGARAVSSSLLSASQARVRICLDTVQIQIEYSRK